MPKSIRTLSPEPRPGGVDVSSRGRIDRDYGSIDIDLMSGLTSRLHVRSGSIFILDSDSPETDTTPLLPGIAPILGDYLASVYADAITRLGRRRSAKLIVA